MRNPKAKVSDPNSFVTNPGSDIHVLYNAELLPNGIVALTPNGKESISEKINAEKQFTDISYIMQRLELGDDSMLRTDVQYGDFTQGPRTLAEHLQIFINARQSFDALDLETKNKFDNNYMYWLQEAGTEDWQKNMSKYIPQPEELVIEKENVADES